MKHNYIQFVLLSGFLLISFLGKSQDAPADLVNPFIDTHNSRWFYFNSASLPFWYGKSKPGYG
jgi:hypothetical protein